MHDNFEATEFLRGTGLTGADLDVCCPIVPGPAHARKKVKTVSSDDCCPYSVASRPPQSRWEHPPAMRMDSRAAKQVAIEQQLVDAMYQRLDAALAEALDARDRVLSNAGNNPTELHLRDAEVARLARLAAGLRAAERSLCIGRIDDSSGGSLHIGRTGVRSPHGAMILVDWRADAARPFYAATLASPLGLHRRRHVRLTGREVVGVSDELLDGSAPTNEDIVGDGPLAETLGRARTGRMRVAVATLQAEQDLIIRSPHRGVTVVDGGPGTGKTIVALHRAAYVLYSFPDIAKQGVLVFGPNRRFLEYISEVLPSLGESDVQMATMADLVGADASVTESHAAARVKGQAHLAEGLARWVSEHQPRNEALRFRVGQESLVLGAAELVEARRRATRGGVAHNPARASFKEYVVESIVKVLETHTTDAIAAIDAEVASMVDIDLDQAIASDLRSLGLDDTIAPDGPEIDWDNMHDALLEDPLLDRAIDGVWPRLRAAEALGDFLADPDALVTHLPALTAEEVSLLTGNRLGYTASDLALLDEARALIEGTPEILYGHIVVDEAQELSEMEWRAIMRRCPAHSMTIVGDVAQTGSATTIRSWSEAVGPFVGSRFDHHTLTVNYRTTAEIDNAASPLRRRIAPEQRVSRSLRHGEKPGTIVVPARDLSEATVGLVQVTTAAHPDDTVGVIAPADEITKLTKALGGTVAMVTEASSVRGLEFDSVFVVDPAAIEAQRPSGARDLYVSLTRATKRLSVIQREA